jgi:hypothetical protein
MDAMDKKNLLPYQTKQSLLSLARTLFSALRYSETQLNAIKAHISTLLFCSLVYYPDQQMYNIYIYIYIYIYINNIFLYLKYSYMLRWPRIIIRKFYFSTWLNKVSSNPYSGNINIEITPLRQSRLYIQPSS